MECTYCGSKPCICKETSIFRGKLPENTPLYDPDIVSNITKTAINESDKILPGAMIRFKSAGSNGSHENIYGVGEISLALHRPDAEYKWVDLGSIYYSAPTPEQYLDAETSPQFSEGNKAHSDINRRLSKKQAMFMVMKIREMIARQFSDGVIPPDDEIDLILKERK